MVKRIVIGIISLMATQKAVSQTAIESAQQFFNSVYKEGRSGILQLDSIKILQRDSQFVSLTNSVEIIFTDTVIWINNFSFSTHDPVRGQRNKFYSGSLGVYGENEPYRLMSTLYLNKDRNDIYELVLYFDEKSAKSMMYSLVLTNTGFDFHFKGKMLKPRH